MCVCLCMHVCVHIRVRCEMYVGFSVGTYVCVLHACMCMCISEQMHKATYLSKMGGSGEKNTNHTNHRTQCFPGNSEQAYLGEVVRKESLESQGGDPPEGRMARPLHSMAEGLPHLIARFWRLFTQSGGVFEKKLQTWIFVKIEPKWGSCRLQHEL